MAVEVLGIGNETDGHGDSIEAFRTANTQNAAALLNVTEGKKKNAPRPIYDPSHVDNQWPKMVYSPTGEKTVGKSTGGVKDPRERKQILDDNQAAYKAALGSGFRDEPYAKPQIVLLDPAAEKAELKRKNDELQGQITALTDLVHKSMAAKAAEVPKT